MYSFHTGVLWSATTERRQEERRFHSCTWRGRSRSRCKKRCQSRFRCIWVKYMIYVNQVKYLKLVEPLHEDMLRRCVG